MDELYLLIATAQLAIALAGFSGVVMALRLRYRDATALPYARLWRLVESSLAAAFFSLLPLVLRQLHVPPNLVWSVCSAIFATYVAAALVYFMTRFWSVWSGTSSHWWFNAPAIVLGAVVVLLLYGNALGIGFAQEFGAYFLGVVFYLSFAGLVFARLLLYGSRHPDEEP